MVFYFFSMSQQITAPVNQQSAMYKTGMAWQAVGTVGRSVTTQHFATTSTLSIFTQAHKHEYCTSHHTTEHVRRDDLFGRYYPTTAARLEEYADMW